MKILNIHGYKGSAENAACAALRGLGQDIISPAIDYDAKTPADVLTFLESILADERPDALTGTSLGGFFAGMLSAKYSLPVIFVNPCLMPFHTLPQLDYTGDIRGYMELFGRLMKLDDHNICTIVGSRDEIIDIPEITRSMLYNDRFVLIPEGMHSGSTLPLEKHFADFLSYIQSII